jgi:hypothetical protein
MSCRIVATVCKTPAETKRVGLDYAAYDKGARAWGFLVETWAPGSVYEDGATVRPTKPTGYQYRCGGGSSGPIEPKWPESIGATVADGSVTWTAEAVGNDSLRATIITSTWSAPDDIGLDSESVVNTGGAQIAHVEVAGGVAGESYEVVNVVVLSDGTVEESIIEVTVAGA